MPWRDPDRNRAYARGNMARLYASRRARRVCVRCGDAPADPGTRCDVCKLAQRMKRGAFTVAPSTSTGALSP